MAKLYFARISSINYEKATADIVIEEMENQIINDVPFLARNYEMPKVRERVAVMIEYSKGDVDKGVILGPVYTVDQKPNKTGKGIFEKRFKDGASVIYDESNQTLEITADKVKVRKLKVDQII